MDELKYYEILKELIRDARIRNPDIVIETKSEPTDDSLEDFIRIDQRTLFTAKYTYVSKAESEVNAIEANAKRLLNNIFEAGLFSRLRDY